MQDPVAEEAATSVAEPSTIGSDLDQLFEQLKGAGFSLGARDRINASALAAGLVASREVRDIRELRPQLAALLARSPGERERFFQVFDGVSPPNVDPEEEQRRLRERRKTSERGEGGSRGSSRTFKLPRWVIPGLVGLVILTAAMAAWQLFSPGTEVKTPTEASTDPDGSERAMPPAPAEAPPPPSGFEILNRVAAAGERFEGAPTLEELSAGLSPGSQIGWTAESYAVRLSELAGLPRGTPLPLYGRDGKDGRTWARIALALARIEQPGREPRFDALVASAAESLGKKGSPGTAYEVANRLHGWFPSAGSLPDTREELVESIRERTYRAETQSEVGEPLPGEALDLYTLDRALAIAGPRFAERVGPEAPWLSSRRAAGASFAPGWVAWLALLLPVTLAILWSANSLALRKAYLRRRPPELPPLHLDIVANAATRTAEAGSALLRRAAQKLRVRTSRPTDRLDIVASIDATLRSGTDILQPMFEQTRRNPEYLVLLERRAGTDQDAERMRSLIRRIESAVPVAVYSYQTEPSRLTPESGGRAVAIEQLMAAYPEHRLIVMGSGTGFLDPVTLHPLPAVEKLTHWSHRALLSPLAVSEWGREELALAEALRIPIGRATPEGVAALAELLGLEGAELESLVEGRGDGLARPLPERMRTRPHAYLYNRPPSGESVAQIIQALRNYLDGPGFEWLSALAVYPALQWDLTLYLGTHLAEETGGDAEMHPLYREDRAAALTQLPWLREGIMQGWLRRALIAELNPQRAAEVRARIKGLIDAARLTGNEHRDDVVKLRIAREPARDRMEPESLLEDEVLLDFLARGNVEDFALGGASWLEQLLPRALSERLGIPELAAALVALAYGVTGFLVAPSPADGALITGAWLPLIALAAGGLVALAVGDPEAAYQTLRRGIFGLAPLACALALFWLGKGTAVLVGGNLWERSQLTGILGLLPPWQTWGVYAATLLAGLLAGRRIAEWLGIPSGTRTAGWPRFVAVLALQTLVLAALLAVVDDMHRTVMASGNGPWATAILSTAGWAAGTFVVIWIASRLLPDKLPRARAKTGTANSGLVFSLTRAGLALAPLAPAILLAAYVSGSSLRLERPVSGGVAAIAEAGNVSNGSGPEILALGGGDGSIDVLSVAGTHATEKVVVPSPDAAVASLALAEAGGATRLAAAYSDGTVRLYDAASGKAVEPEPSFLAALGGSPSRVVVAFAGAATPVVATESEAGQSLLVSADGTLPIAAGGPVTALVGVGDGLVAVATLDGKVRLAHASAGAAPLLSETAGMLTIPGRARRLSYDPGAQLLTAYGEDGTVASVKVVNGNLDVAGASRDKVADLSLGASIEWTVDGTGHEEEDVPGASLRLAGGVPPGRPAIRVFDLKGDTVFPGTLIVDEAKDFYAERVPSEAAKAVEVTRALYRYFDEELGQPNPFQGEGGQFEIFVRHKTRNAYWCASKTADCPKASTLVLGEGYGTATDVMIAELWRGVIQSTSDLVYANEPGAVNNSLTDFFGLRIDAWMKGKEMTWQLGANLPGFSDSQPLRSLSDPTLAGDGDPESGFDRAARYSGKNRGQPDHYSQLLTPVDTICGSTRYQDNGCIHFNSGILNKGLYLATAGGEQSSVRVGGIGATKMARVLFRAQNVNMNATTGLVEAASAIELSCTELAQNKSGGLQSRDCDQVAAAMRAVGLEPGATPPTQTDKVNEAKPQPGPTSETSDLKEPQAPPEVAPKPDTAFAYYPPGDITGGGGRLGDRKVYLPDIIFPLKLEPGQHAYINSQIYGYGGYKRGGAESNPANFDAMVQRDSYCEAREWTMPLCPAGKGHQGVDIRPPSPKANVWPVVAVADGTITKVTASPAVELVGADGSAYRYLQMNPKFIRVKVGQKVRQGEVIGFVSNIMNGSAQTTIHLHFETRQAVDINGKRMSVLVPPYASLIAAYRRLKLNDPGIDSEGNLVIDPEHEIGAGKIARPPEPVALGSGTSDRSMAQPDGEAGPQDAAGENGSGEAPRQSAGPYDGGQEPENFGRFDGDLVVTALDENSVVVETSFAFIDADGVEWRVPAGAKADFSSLPKSLWTSQNPLTGNLRQAAILHDHFSRTRERPWQDTQRMFYDAMRASGVSAQTARLMYAAAYSFGPRWEADGSAGGRGVDGESADAKTADGAVDRTTEPPADEADGSAPYPTMPPLDELRDEYISLFETAKIRPERRDAVRQSEKRLLANRDRYEAVEKETGVPWWFTGLIHGLEAGYNFRAHLHNGDTLDKRTTHVPAGRPVKGEPPFTWEESAVDALRQKGFDQETSWALPETLYRLERYHGIRTRVLHKINTPYLWSFTNHYEKGQYVADNVWDPNAVSKLPGAAAVLKLLVEDGEVNFDEDPRGVTRGLSPEVP